MGTCTTFAPSRLGVGFVTDPGKRRRGAMGEEGDAVGDDGDCWQMLTPGWSLVKVCAHGGWNWGAVC